MYDIWYGLVLGYIGHPYPMYAKSGKYSDCAYTGRLKYAINVQQIYYT